MDIPKRLGAADRRGGEFLARRPIPDAKDLIPGHQRLAVRCQVEVVAAEMAQLPPALDVPEANQPVLSLAREDRLAVVEELHLVRPGMTQARAPEPRDGPQGKGVAVGIL